jgi:hypothetical protein
MIPRKNTPFPKQLQIWAFFPPSRCHSQPSLSQYLILLDVDALGLGVLDAPDALALDVVALEETARLETETAVAPTPPGIAPVLEMTGSLEPRAFAAAKYRA